MPGQFRAAGHAKLSKCVDIVTRKSTDSLILAANSLSELPRSVSRHSKYGRLLTSLAEAFKLYAEER